MLDRSCYLYGMNHPKRPSDVNVMASQIVNEATQEKPASIDPTKEKNPAAVALGRLGGLKGGRARAEKLSAKRRREIAQNAAKSRWANKPH